MNRPLVIAGDVGQVAIPVVALSTTLFLRDYKGSAQFLEAGAADAVTVFGLKYLINEKRPSGHARQSFPSGHTAISFCGAGFIHRRYGFKYAAPAYVGALVVATARVQSQAHWMHDVVAGAAIGLFYGFIFTSPYDSKTQVAPEMSEDGVGVRCSHQF